MQIQVLQLLDAKRPLFSFYEISEHLKRMNYPLKSIQLMQNCGNKTEDFILQNCVTCGYSDLKPIHYACNLRTCSICAPKRSRKLFKKYNEVVQDWSACRGSLNSIYFLTISPKNYGIEGLKEGIEHIKRSWRKFTKTKYIKERIKGGLWIVETKQDWVGKPIYDKWGNLLYNCDEDSWNVHIHALFYGRRLDNAIRGFCKDCRQNYIKYDKFTKKYYCANRKCNSLNVDKKKDSKIVSLFKKSSGVDVNIDIKEFDSSTKALGYSLKYVSQNKDSFENAYRMAQYIVDTKSQKLVCTFGVFYKFKFAEFKLLCPCCGDLLSHTFDRFVINMILEERRKKGYEDEFNKFIESGKLKITCGAIAPLYNSGSPIASNHRNI